MSDNKEIVAQAASVGWDEIRLWGAFLISIASLIWSERNRRAGNRATLAIRREAIRLEEFRTTVKTPLLDALAECETAGTKAEAIATSSQSLKQLRQDIEDLNRSTIGALGKLQSRLTDANESSFAEGSDWLNGFNELEDEILGRFNAAAHVGNQEATRREALLRAKASIGKLRTTTKSRIEDHINKITTMKI